MAGDTGGMAQLFQGRSSSDESTAPAVRFAWCLMVYTGYAGIAALIGSAIELVSTHGAFALIFLLFAVMAFTSQSYFGFERRALRDRIKSFEARDFTPDRARVRSYWIESFGISLPSAAVAGAYWMISATSLDPPTINAAVVSCAILAALAFALAPFFIGLVYLRKDL